MACKACQYVKQSKHPYGSAKTQTGEEKETDINKGDMFPIHRISVDHYISSVTGQLYNFRCGSQEKDMFCGGMISTNHASGYV